MPFAALASFLATAGAAAAEAAAAAGTAIAEGAAAAGNAIAAGAETVGSAVAEGAATAGSAIADGAASAGNWVADFGENVATGFNNAGNAANKTGIIARDAAGSVEWGNTLARAAGTYGRNRMERKLKQSPTLATLYAVGKEGLQ